MLCFWSCCVDDTFNLAFFFLLKFSEPEKQGKQIIIHFWVTYYELTHVEHFSFFFGFSHLHTQEENELQVFSFWHQFWFHRSPWLSFFHYTKFAYINSLANMDLKTSSNLIRQRCISDVFTHIQQYKQFTSLWYIISSKPQQVSLIVSVMKTSSLNSFVSYEMVTNLYKHSDCIAPSSGYHYPTRVL